MALINCPECGNACSSTALACPQCGYTFAVPVAEPEVIVREAPRREKGFPAWAFAPLIILGALVVFLLIWMLRGNDDETARNINVNMSAPRTNERVSVNTARNSATPNEIVVPGSSSQPSEITVPSTSAPTNTGSQTTTISPGSTYPAGDVPPASASTGTLAVEAKVASRTGSQQPVQKEKFYLLDKDLQSILLEAGIEDEEGQGLVNAFGMSVLYPNRYGDVNRKALAAINRHVIHSVTTDSAGKAQIKDIKPDTYYIFGITKTRSGFAVWDAPVTIQGGQNNLVLPAKTLTEVTEEQ